MLTLLIFKLAGMVTAAAVSSGAAVGVWYLNRRWNLQLSELELQRIAAFAHENPRAIFAGKPFAHTQGQLGDGHRVIVAFVADQRCVPFAEQ